MQIFIPRITDKFGNFRTSRETDEFPESDNLNVPKLNCNTGSLLVLSFNALIATHYVYFLQGSMLTQSEGQSERHIFFFFLPTSSCCSVDQFLGEQQCKRNSKWTCWKRSR